MVKDIVQFCKEFIYKNYEKAQDMRVAIQVLLVNSMQAKIFIFTVQSCISLISMNLVQQIKNFGGKDLKP